MNTATIRRGTGRNGRGGMSAREARRAPPRKGLVTRTIEALPLDEDQLHRLLTWLLGLILLAMVAAAAMFLGLPAMAWDRVSDTARRAGLQVAKVEVHGAQRMNERAVYDLAVAERDRSMLALDLTGLRARLQTLKWVKEARVTRRLPDTLVVDIVERKPVAVWQHDCRLELAQCRFDLIDAEGVDLAPVDPQAMPAMPLVMGPDANRQTAALTRLLASAPTLRRLLTGGTWVGNRRWDLHFRSGETLALPEGEAAAAAALINFARMEGVERLLGRGIIRFDMRDPARFVLRLPPGMSGGEAAPQPPAIAPADPPAAAAPDTAKPEAGKAPAAPATTA
jgi:cell division protein FtsQ